MRNHKNTENPANPAKSTSATKRLSYWGACLAGGGLLMAAFSHSPAIPLAVPIDGPSEEIKNALRVSLMRDFYRCMNGKSNDPALSSMISQISPIMLLESGRVATVLQRSFDGADGMPASDAGLLIVKTMEEDRSTGEVLPIYTSVDVKSGQMLHVGNEATQGYAQLEHKVMVHLAVQCLAERGPTV